MKIVKYILISTLLFFSVFLIIRRVNNAGPLMLSTIKTLISQVPSVSPLTTFTDLVDGWNEIVEGNAFYDIINILLLGGLTVIQVLTAFVSAVFTMIYDIYLYISWLAPYLLGIN